MTTSLILSLMMNKSFTGNTPCSCCIVMKSFTFCIRSGTTANPLNITAENLYWTWHPLHLLEITKSKYLSLQIWIGCLSKSLNFQLPTSWNAFHEWWMLEIFTARCSQSQNENNSILETYSAWTYHFSWCVWQLLFLNWNGLTILLSPCEIKSDFSTCWLEHRQFRLGRKSTQNSYHSYV